MMPAPKFPQYKTVPTASLIPYVRNARTHSPQQVDKIAASIREFGFLSPIITDGQSGIVAGHGRVMAAQKLGLDTLPTIDAAHLTEAQRRAYVLADNRMALDAGWDNDLLKIELQDLDAAGFDLTLTGFDLGEIAALTLDPTEGLTDPDAVPDAPAVPVTVLGDVWLLGRHRLMCGDSTSIDAVERLMDGQRADLIHTDPPYGIGYGGSMALGQERFGWKQHSGGWDETRPPKEFFDLAEAQCKNRIIWGGNYFSDYLPPTMGWLVWDKGQRGFSLADGEMAWTSFDNAMRIKDLARATANREEKHHATQKPLIIVEWALEYADRHAKQKPILILDLFGGSGSTLIACEKTARDCRMMELDPRYSDIILQRWADFTGKDPVREDGAKWSELTKG